MDPSGVTEDGEVFGGIGEYKRHLLDYSEQVVRNGVETARVSMTRKSNRKPLRSRENFAAMKDDGYPMKS